MSFKINKSENNAKDILKELEKLDRMKIRWGANTERSAEIFMQNEFGTSRNGKPHIPSRPAMRLTFRDSKVQKIIAGKAKFVIEQITQGKKALDAGRGIGESGLAELKRTFTSNLPPANAESTIKKKGAGKNTLRDTGELFNDLDYEVIS